MFHLRVQETKNAISGFALVEIVVASAIVAMLIAGVIGVAQKSLRAENAAVKRVQAAFLAEEGLEAARVLRDISWSGGVDPLASGVPYYPVFSTSTSSWSFDTVDPGPLLQTFTRSIVVSDVYRDETSEDIVAATSSGAVLDPETKHFNAQVVWPGNADGIAVETYLTNLFED